MLKKVISLALAGVLLLQTGNTCTFAYNKDEFDVTKEPRKIDYCKDFPKNQHGQTVDIDCAFTQLLHDQKASNGRSPGQAIKVGPNGDHEIRMWHKEHILTLENTLKNWVKTSHKNVIKYSFIGNLIEKTNEILSLNSTVLAAEVAKKWVVTSQYFNEIKITSDDIEEWEDEYIERPKFKTNKTDYDECKFFYPIRYFCKKSFQKKLDAEKDAFYETFRQEQARNRREGAARVKAYSLLMEQIFTSILKKGYEGKDTLVAILNLNENNYEAQAYFTNIGLSQKIDEQEIGDSQRYSTDSLNNFTMKDKQKNNEDDL